MPNRVPNLHSTFYGLVLLFLQVVGYVLCRREVLILLLNAADYIESSQLFMAIQSIDEYGSWLASNLEVALAHLQTAMTNSLQFIRIAHQQSLDSIATSEKQLNVATWEHLEGVSSDLARQPIRALHSTMFHSIESAAAIYRVISGVCILIAHLVKTSPYFERLAIAGKYAFALYIITTISWGIWISFWRVLRFIGFTTVAYITAGWRWLWYSLFNIG
ncbi:hypothetical protein COCHEDRAFT_1027725 [Bipolaris maydis C5]|uniref:Uncharacterized protein n=2 Tax=Cochliobolus heterostrophus TaxID=5016 RepID=M2UNT6_COCH5|nr:hypothetical protein COCHEDRAFT_1027725 [Bipolaris maydis C5]KAH7551165.1 hypothetical protein BM1_10039 [Bipolaris maydis]KAJ5021868.1 hypothetical protein J3E73DRAFT_261622 [Bipolaris maydis]KAJ5055043.1 hypothetical protein J3E74DRAFT_411493 [Bipolaris maydis]KAJ6214264.1 hypothetical protein PSV09DRAFT_1027725 [Bipolaris maydis]